jgi:DNA polymerase-3 subunit beta
MQHPSITLDHGAFSRAVLTAASVAASPLGRTGKKTVYLHANAGTLTIRAIGDGVEFSTQVAASTPDASCRWLIPADTLAAAVRALPAHCDVALSHVDGRLALRGGSARFSLLGEDPDNYPAFRVAGDLCMRVTFEQHQLHRLFSIGASARPTKDHRRVLLYSHLDRVDDGRFRLTSTDGKRMVRLTVAAKEVEAGDASFKPLNLPEELTGFGASHLASKPPKKGETAPTCELSLYTEGAALSIPGVGTLAALSYQGKYPNVDEAVPKTFSGQVDVVSTSLVAAAARARVTAPDTSRLIILTINPEAKVLSYRSVDADTGDCTGEVPATVQMGGAAEVGFNADFLSEILSHLGDTVVSMHYRAVPRKTASGEPIPDAIPVVDHPVVFSAASVPDLFLLLMPINIKNWGTPTTEPDQNQKESQ